MTEDPPAAVPGRGEAAPSPDSAAAGPGPQTAAAAPRREPSDDGPVAGAAGPDGPVAGAAGLLAQLSDRPLPEHPDVYDQVHGELRRALADIDDA